ncbi:MAG TPA: FKBP-type peptidyl-prolyl cis-trans isomerase [Flavobacteriales bacterium]
MKKIMLLGAISMMAFQGFSQNLKNHKDSLSYALGVNLAESLKKSGITEYNEAVFLEAVKAHLAGKSTMTEQVADKLYKEEQRRIANAAAAANLKAGQDFLANNAKQPGVKVTSSGLQYKTIVEGTGASPGPNDRVNVHYHGTLIDGTVFDSSVQRGQPISFGLNQVISGWTEGLQLMKEGGKTIFYIPAELAYGPRAQGKIPANSTLIFEVELFKVEK